LKIGLQWAKLWTRAGFQIFTHGVEYNTKRIPNKRRYTMNAHKKILG